MRALVANVEEVFREAAARYTLIAYFALSSLFILLFAFAIRLDIVNGALAGARIFGKSVELGAGLPSVDQLVLGFESGFSGFLFAVATFLSVFATAHLVPRLVEKGTVDLWLSRPIGRVPLLLSRYLGGLLLSAANVAYLFGAIWLIVVWKTKVVHPRFLLAGAIVLFAVAVLLAFSFLVGVATSSTAVSIMGTYALFFLSAILVAHGKLAALVDANWKANVIHGLYWAFPKLAELGQAVVALVAGPSGHGHLNPPPPLALYGTSALFALACLALASLLFRRKDF